LETDSSFRRGSLPPSSGLEPDRSEIKLPFTDSGRVGQLIAAA
jgi:hypothetical protein